MTGVLLEVKSWGELLLTDYNEVSNIISDEVSGLQILPGMVNCFLCEVY